MKFDDVARRAAEHAHRMAARVGDPLDAAAYRDRRMRRTRVLAGAAVGSVLLTAVAVLVLTRPPDDTAAVSTTLPDTTVPTTGVTTTTHPGGVSGEPVPILGAGWEELDAGPIAGRYGVATAWTGTELFAWGGGDTPGLEDQLDYSWYHQDGFLFDPQTAIWRPVEPLPDEVCSPLGQTQAIAVDDVIILKGAALIVDDCVGTAAYHPETGTWEPLRGDFFSRLAPLVSVAWTGELLVAPRQQMAYDWFSPHPLDLPAFPGGADDAVHSPQRAHWTGDRVLAIGSGSLRAWTPGDDAWVLLDGPPVPERARDSVWTDEGLMVVTYDMATAFYRDEEWTRPGDLPLRFYECLPEASSVGGTPVVRMCSGVAVWDAVRAAWIPMALSDVSGSSGGTLVGTDDALYEVGPHLRRLRIERDADGSIAVPPTIPIGVMQLDIPDGFELVSSFAPEQGAEGFIPDDSTIGVVFEASAGRVCTVSSTYTNLDLAFEGAIATVLVDRPGRTPVEAHEFPGVEGGVGLAIATGTSDFVMVFCENPPPLPDQDLARSDALAFVAGLWSPWDEPVAEPEAYVTEGDCGIENMSEGWQDNAIRYGPLWLWHVAPAGQGGPGADPSTKTIAVLEPGVSVTLTIAPSYVHRAAHLYNSDRWNSGGAYRVDRHERAVTFLPCADEPAQFVGGFVFTGDPCVEVTVAVGDAEPYTAALPFRSGPCSETIFTQSPSDCPAAAPHLTGSAGSLPVKGDTDRDRVAAIIERDRAEILQHLFTEYFIRAVDVRIVERRGEVWYWDDLATASYAIERAVDYQIEVLLDPGAPCPDGGTRCDDIPIVFNRAWVAHEAEGYRFEVPAGWIVAEESLTPALAIPTEIFSAATFPMRPGGSRCAQVPEFALEVTGPTSAFVSVQLGPGRYASLPHPEEFTYEWLDEWGANTEAAECLYREDRHDLYIRWVAFVDGDRALLVFVAIGDDASEETRAQVLDLLNSMEYVGGWPGVAEPSP
ncbi:MAG: hypothetical protein WEA29_05780 [Acidimicrobiia bacterium]